MSFKVPAKIFLKHILPTRKLQIYYGFQVSVIVLLFLIYPTIVGEIFNLFSCTILGTSIDSNNNPVTFEYLDIDLDYQCWTPDHYGWIYSVGIPLGILYIIFIPLLALYLLHRDKHRLNYFATRSTLGFLL